MKKILGMPITLFVIGLIVVGGASAALVSYLSNTVSMSTTVSTPLVMTGDILLSVTTVAGSPIHYKVTTVNNAESVIYSFPVTEITGPAGKKFMGNEFTSIIIKQPQAPDGVEVGSDMKYVKSDGTLALFSEVEHDASITDTVKLVYDLAYGPTFDFSKGYPRAVGFNEWNDLTISTNGALAPGVYTIKSCQLFDLKANC